MKHIFNLWCLPDSDRLLREVCLNEAIFSHPLGKKWGEKIKREIKRISFPYNLVPPRDADWSAITFPEPSRCLGRDCSHPSTTTTHNHKSKHRNRAQSKKRVGSSVRRWMMKLRKTRAKHDLQQRNGILLPGEGKLISPRSRVPLHHADSHRPVHIQIHRDTGWRPQEPQTRIRLSVHFVHLIPQGHCYYIQQRKKILFPIFHSSYCHREVENQQSDNMNFSRTNSLLLR